MMRNLVACLAAALGADALAVTPVEKVIELLKGLQAQVEKQGQDEAAAYDQYACFCKEQASNKLFMIENANKTISDLAADISFYDGKITALGKSIKGLQQDKNDTEADMANITSIRKGENGIYVTKRDDLEASIKAVKLATEAIKEQSAKMTDTQKNRQAFLEVNTPAHIAYKVVAEHLQFVDIDPASKQFHELSAFLQQGKPGKAHGYKFHSQDILKLLSNLQGNFEEKLAEVEADERRSREAYDVDHQGLTNELQKIEQALEEDKESYATYDDKRTDADAQKGEATQQRDDNQAFLDDLTTQCEEKARDWDDRSGTRSDELTALAEALRILDEGVKSEYNANKKLVGLVSRHSAVARQTSDSEANAVEEVASTGNDDTDLLQENEDDDVSFIQTETEDIKASKRAIRFIEQQARMLKSPLLTTLSIKVSVSGDPFKRVRSLITDLINKLKKEKAAEAAQESSCKTQMSTLNGDLDTYQIAVAASLSTKQNLEEVIDETQATIDTLEEKIKTDQATMDKAQKLRDAEQAENKRVVTEATNGYAAVNSAIITLNKFYTNAKNFVQVDAPGYQTREYTHVGASDAEGNRVEDIAPETYASDYEGSQNQSKGIIGMLEVIRRDFERTKTETTTAESTAAGIHSGVVTAHGIQKTADTTALNQAKSKLSTKKGELDDEKDTLKTKKGLVEKTRKGLEAIKELCVDSGVDAEQRFALRKQEIEALREAQKILRSVDVDLPGNFKETKYD